MARQGRTGWGYIFARLPTENTFAWWIWQGATYRALQVGFCIILFLGLWLYLGGLLNIVQCLDILDKIDNDFSAGIGRTGTFLAVDYLLEQAKAEGVVDLVKYTYLMRSNRMNMIQTPVSLWCVNWSNIVAFHVVLCLYINERLIAYIWYN